MAVLPFNAAGHDFLQAALEYADKGWRVFPCDPDGTLNDKGKPSKEPLKRLAPRGYKSATTDAAQIRRWWHQSPNANIGLALAPSGLVAVDPDTYKADCGWQAFIQGREIPATFEQSTSSGGRHYVFETPEGAQYPDDELCAGVDIKHKGYILLEPSRVNGKPYRIEADDDPAPAPDWLPRKATKAANKASTASPALDHPVDIERAEAYAAEAEPAVEDNCGGTQTYRVACELRDMGLSEREAFRVLAEIYNPRCRPPWDDRPNARGRDALADRVASAYRNAQNASPGTKSAAQASGGDQPEPVDIFANAEPPELPSGLLPRVIEDFANVQGEMMGADPAGLAMAALATCSAAITDNVQVQPKLHEPHWTESPRIWTALIGDPSTKKSPIIRAAARPITKIDAKLFKEWQRQMAEYNALPKEERAAKQPPPQKRKRLEDVTIEAAQDVLKDNPEGVLCLQDELSGWFGSMDKYASGKGSAKDRGFWLQAYNGGGYALNRVGRGAAFIPNLSVALLGGIQPSPIRRVARDAVDDGLLQRLLPIVLRPADVGKDEAPPRDVVGDFETLVTKLTRRTEPQRAGFDGEPEPSPIHLDEGAQAIRRDLEHYHLRLVQLEGFNAKLGAHFGKYDGLFARLCILFHAIENADADTLPLDVSEDTARRVRDFTHRFLRQHALSFYHGTLTLEDSGDQLTAVAGFILAHSLARLTGRDVQRGNRAMRSMSKDDVSDVMDRLELMGWVTPAERHRSDSLAWNVNPLVHERFASRAERERQQRQEIHQMLQEVGTS